MIIKEHTRNQRRMYRIHKMEEQLEKDKYIIGNLQQKIDKAIKCLNYYTCNKEFLSVEEQELYEILKGE